MKKVIAMVVAALICLLLMFNTWAAYTENPASGGTVHSPGTLPMSIGSSNGKEHYIKNRTINTTLALGKYYFDKGGAMSSDNLTAYIKTLSCSSDEKYLYTQIQGDNDKIYYNVYRSNLNTDTLRSVKVTSGLWVKTVKADTSNCFFYSLGKARLFYSTKVVAMNYYD